jgi:hypothetical protein
MMFNQYLPPELTLAQKTKKERIAQAVDIILLKFNTLPPEIVDQYRAQFAQLCRAKY